VTFQDDSTDSDFRFDEKLQRRTGSVKRPKASRRRTLVPGRANQLTPGGIRQRRNKRWAW
jgi:hypothetical protein